MSPGTDSLLMIVQCSLQCVEESKLCDNDSPIAMLKEITLGPLYATDSKSEPEDTENYNANSTISKIQNLMATFIVVQILMFNTCTQKGYEIL